MNFQNTRKTLRFLLQSNLLCASKEINDTIIISSRLHSVADGVKCRCVDHRWPSWCINRRCRAARFPHDVTSVIKVDFVDLSQRTRQMLFWEGCQLGKDHDMNPTIGCNCVSSHTYAALLHYVNINSFRERVLYMHYFYFMQNLLLSLTVLYINILNWDNINIVSKKSIIQSKANFIYFIFYFFSSQLNHNLQL